MRMTWMLPCAIVYLMTLWTGCGAVSIYADMKTRLANADAAEQRAAMLTMYRECLQTYQTQPDLAKTNCEHYTQALTVFDVRGIK